MYIELLPSQQQLDFLLPGVKLVSFSFLIPRFETRVAVDELHIDFGVEYKPFPGALVLLELRLVAPFGQAHLLRSRSDRVLLPKVDEPNGQATGVLND
eukprot:IDg13325t1